jgi:hypothetical protein
VRLRPTTPLLLAAALVAGVVMAGSGGIGAAASCGGATIFVGPGGSDANPGTQDQPLRSIQEGLERAQPGSVVSLAAGEYREAVHTVRSGTSKAPIVVCGHRGAILRGTPDAARIVEVNHDHVTLEGFTIDGLHGDPGSAAGYNDKLLYAIGTAPGDGVVGLRLLHMTFRNAGGECVRLRYFAQRNEVAHSTFDTCGVYDFRFKQGGKNGEGMYIGTAPEQQGLNGAPDAAADRSDRNWIHHNAFYTRGNECVDIKENSRRNLVEHNVCTKQRDKESGGFDSRGNRNVFRFNRSFGNRGSGIRFGGDGHFEGTHNSAYRNVLHDNGGYGVQMTRNRQNRICGNTIRRNKRGPIRGPRAKLRRYMAGCPRGTPKP